MSRNLIALACVGLVSVPSALADITMMYPRTGVSAATAIPTTNSFVSEGLKGWKDAPDATFQYFPAQYTGVTFQSVVPEMTRIPAGATTNFDCPVTDNGEPCNVAVFYYSCYPCESAKGNIGMVLSAYGFERTRCAPTFTTGVAGGIQHRMIGYVKTIDSGASVSIVTDSELDFALFVQSFGGGVTCSDLSAYDCEQTDFCTYTYGQCQLASCVAAGPSFGGGCDTNTCALGELGLTL